MAMLCQDPNISQATLLQNYINTFDNNIDNAHSLITNEDESIVLNSLKLNSIVDTVNSVQTSFFNDIINTLENNKEIFQEWINNIVTNSGQQWVETNLYKKNDIVSNENNTYLCIQDAPSGTLLTDSNYWISLSLQGKQGYSSLGVQWLGEWDSDNTYNVNDLVWYGNNSIIKLYVATTTIPVNSPSPDINDNWTLALTIDKRGICYEESLPYPYNNLMAIKKDNNMNVDYYYAPNIKENPIPLNIITIVPSVILNASNIPYIEEAEINMTSAIQLLYQNYNLNS